ncbi:hypothetical protein ACOBR2_13080 [Telmatobacter bradus]|uniref:hypothetical protein n=1 Tax=Telmatobacter bradus TaxID=474953 RepID=UPI003B438D21
MGSLRFEGVRFIAYPEDHEPCHLHGFYAEIEVIIELRGEPVWEAALSWRAKAICPPSAKRADVQYVLRVAAENAEVLIKLWEEAHA